MVVPVDEHVARRGKNIGGATLQRERRYLNFEEEKDDKTDFEESSGAQREHSQELQGRGERGKVVDLHQLFGLRSCKDFLNWG